MKTDTGLTDSDLDLPRDLQPPMANGEILFEAPWQGRVFAMAVALHEAGVFEWSEFQQALIDVVGVWDARVAEHEPYRYYELFEQALSNLLACKAVLEPEMVTARCSVLAARPHGHDH